MRRHTKPAAPQTLRASGDRWLFGYADIVTLLFACFASLYATQIAPASAARPPRDIALVTEDVPTEEDAVVTALQRDLQAIADDESASAFVDVGTTSRGVVLSLTEAGSFPTGRADLTPQATKVMLTVAEAIRGLPNLVRVEGHTDDAPIRTAMFASNWELSTARATRVVQLLTETGRLDPARLSAAGYAEYRPRLPNTSTEARARNRRVDIVVLDAAAARAEAPVENGR